MRELTKKQKKLLDQWFAEAEPSKEAEVLFGKTNELYCVEHLTTEQFEMLEKINDTEVLWQNVNRYLMDKSMESKR